jgi:hypothetical protein
MKRLLNLLFGCSCQNLTFPITRNGETYRVCLDCGKEYKFDWLTMSLGEVRETDAGRTHTIIDNFSISENKTLDKQTAVAL